MVSITAMRVKRRGVLKLLAGVAFALTGGWNWPRGVRAGTAPLTLRPVSGADAEALRSIMKACGGDEDAFFGKCSEWTLDWAKDFIARCPDTPVLSRDGVPLAFLEVPPIAAAPASSEVAVGEAEALSPTIFLALLLTLVGLAAVRLRLRPTGVGRR